MDDESRQYLQSMNVNPDQRGMPGEGWFGGNHFYFIYDANGEPKVQQIPLPSPMFVDGKWVQGEFTDPPAGARAPAYSRTPAGAYGGGVYPTPEPRAKYRSDGTVEVAGWLPGNRWVDLDGTIFSKSGGDTLTTLMTAAVNYAKGIIAK